MNHSPGPGHRPRHPIGRAGLLLAVAAGFLPPGPAAGKGHAAPPSAPIGRTLPAAPGTGWQVANEWDLAGTYVEACTDPLPCPSLFGQPSAGPEHRKIIALDITRGRWQRTDLTGLKVAVVVTAPAELPIEPRSRASWTSCRLFVPETADSMQVVGLANSVGLLLRGPGGPLFDTVEKSPLVMGITDSRIILDVPEQVGLDLRPADSIDRGAPSLTNLGHAFRFLGPIYVYDADTLYCAPGGRAPWGGRHRSGAASSFAWNSAACYDEAARLAKAP